MVHCLFEQSGTFKNVFRSLGYRARDYDILNDYGETDVQIDLFQEIENGFHGKPSIFDLISPDDLVLAFFPCTRFESQVQLWFRGDSNSQKTWSDESKLLYSMFLHDELANMYRLFTQMTLIAIRRKLKLIVENPFNPQHYLVKFYPIKPKVIDMDRYKHGDYFNKPTQYWYFNYYSSFNVPFEPLDYQVYYKIEYLGNQVKRSEISPQYARYFILSHILTKEQFNEVQVKERKCAIHEAISS